MTDIASLNIRINSLEAKMAKQDLDRLTGAGQQTERQMGIMSKAAARMGAALAAAFSTYQMAQFIKTTTLAYARFETLGMVMNTVGRNAGYSAQEMAGFEKQLRESGIAMTETRATLTRMTQAQIDLTKSSELARIAQDAAVIGNINSSEAFERMIHGIQSAQVEVLRTIGLNVNFEQSYKKLADQLGKTSADLTEVEKTQARVNVVMEAGTRIAGVYEAAMDTAGKKFGSMSRHVDDLMVVIGKTFNQTFADGIDAVTEILKATRSWVEANEELLQMGFNEGLSKTIDILKILVVLVGARLVAAFAKASFALGFNLTQWVAYQATLARAAGLTKTVAAGQVAMAAAVGVGSRALALVGGPVGAATLAALAVYHFREELRLVPPDADKAARAVDKLTDNLQNLNEVQAAHRKFEIMDEIDKQVKNLGRIEREIRRVQLIAGEDGTLHGQAGAGARKLAELRAEADSFKQSIDRLQSSLSVIDVMPISKNDAENIRRTANAMDHAAGKTGKLTTGTKELSDEAKKAAEELKKVKKALDEFGLSAAMGMFETFDFSKVANDRVIAETVAAETTAQIWKEKHEAEYALRKQMAAVSYDELNELDRSRSEQEKALFQQTQAALTDDHKRATLTQKEYEIYQLDSVYEYRKKILGDSLTLQEWYTAEYKRITEDELKDLTLFQEEMLKRMQAELADTFTDIRKNGIDDWQDMADRFVQIWLRMLEEMAAAAVMKNLFEPMMTGSGDGWLSSAIGFGASLFSGAGGGAAAGATSLSNGAIINPSGAVFGMADGGPVSPREMYEVNERGPELLYTGGKQYLMMGDLPGFVNPLPEPVYQSVAVRNNNPQTQKNPTSVNNNNSSLTISVPVTVEGSKSLGVDLQRRIEAVVEQTIREHS